MDFQAIKNNAKDKVKTDLSKYLLISLLFSAIVGALTTTVIGSLLSGVFSFGFTYVCVNINLRNNIEYSDLFYYFKDGDTILKIVVISLLQTLLIFLWSLLFVIPGIIKAISYSMVPYIYVDGYQGSEMDLLKKSEEMMKGHKMELVKLWFSFIGWWLLIPLTCGILSIYVTPMWRVALADFYKEIKYQGEY